METATTTCSFAPVFPYNPDHHRKQPQLSQSPDGFPQLRDQWIAEFETFASADSQVKLFGQIFRPQKWQGENAHKAIFILHGQGEHGGRYIHWPFYVGDTVSSVYALDHRGHGRSKGNRGHVDNFDLYAADAALAINRFYEYLLEKFGKAELHLFGHSMGGQIALRTLLQHQDLPISSVTLSSPMFDLAFPVPKVKEMAGRVLRKLLPKFPMQSSPLGDLISTDPGVCAHYKKDPLNHGMISPSFFFSYLEAKEDTLSRAGELDMPILMQVGMDDRIILPRSIVQFYDKLSVEDRQLIRYDHFYHELYNEPERERVFVDLCQWLHKHSQ